MINPENNWHRLRKNRTILTITNPHAWYYSKPVRFLKMHRRRFNNGRELSRNSSAGVVRRKSALSRLFSGCRRRSRWCSQRERTGRVYRSGWKSRHDEYEDWANNAGFRVRRRLHSSSLTPYNTYVRETSASRTFLFLFFFLSFVGWLPVPRCRRVLFLPFASFLVFSGAYFLSSFSSFFFWREWQPETMCTYLCSWHNSEAGKSFFICSVLHREESVKKRILVEAQTRYKINLTCNVLCPTVWQLRTPLCYVQIQR